MQLKDKQMEITIARNMAVGTINISGYSDKYEAKAMNKQAAPRLPKTQNVEMYTCIYYDQSLFVIILTNVVRKSDLISVFAFL